MIRTRLFWHCFLLLVLGNQHTIFAQTPSVTEGCPPLLVDFSPPADQAAYFWSFGNNVTSTERDPSTTFTQPGTYTVELRTGQGGSLVGTTTINVYPRPELNLTIDTSTGCVPLLINFEAQATLDENIDIQGYSWAYGDGDTGAGNSPTHVYGTPGIYTVSLELMATQRGCSLTEVFPNLIRAGGIENVNFLTSPNPATTCDPPLIVNFVNLTPNPDGNLSFRWDLGDGTTFEGTTAPTTTYTEPGQYVVELVASDSLGCSRNRRRPVFIASPNVDLEAIPDTVCPKVRYYYEEWAQADSIGWDWPASALLLRDEMDIPFVTFPDPGVYQLGIRAVNNTPIYCALDTVLTIVVDEVLATPLADPTFTCIDSMEVSFTAESTTATQFFWVFDKPMGTAEGMEVTHTFDVSDTLTYSENGFHALQTLLIAVNPSGCLDTFWRTDTIFTPDALFMTDFTEGCAPLTVTFSDSTNSFSPILEYVYDYGDGSGATFMDDSDHQHTYTQAGEYPVTLHIHNENGCRDTSYTRWITVGEPLSYDFEYVNNPLCPDDTVQYVLETELPQVDWLELQDDTLFAVYNGCISEVINPSLNIQGPVVKINYEIDCESPYEVMFSADARDATGIIWDFGDGNSSAAVNPDHRYSETGDYLVTVTATNPATPCPTYADTMLICIRDLQADFELPDAICANTSLDLDASATQDVVGEFCSGGFTWYFDLNGRPVQGNDTILNKTFSTPGRETVMLIAKDINGCRDTIRKSMNIYSIQPNFTVSDTLICLPATVTFTDNSSADTTLVDWQWQFGDGTTASGATVNHTFTTPPAGGGFEVTLALEDAQGCPQNDTTFIRVYTPTSSILSSPIDRGLCVGETITFSGSPFTEGGSFLDYSWEFSNFPGSEEDEVTQTYAEAGVFNVTMNYVEVGSGCMGSQATTINVQDYPTASFTTDVDGDPVICTPATISFTSTSEPVGALSFVWNFDNNGPPVTGANPTITLERGSYEVSLRATTSNGCSDEILRSFEIVGPEGDFSFPNTPICRGEAVTFMLQDTADVSSWTWDFGDGNIENNTNPATHTYADLPPASSLPVTLILRGEDETCEFSVTRDLAIRNVRADFALNMAGDTALCAGTYSLINSSIGAESYLWTLPNGETSTSFEPNVTFEPGSYTITLRVENTTEMCVDEETKTFTFFALPNVRAMADTVCLGDTTTLSVLGNQPDWTLSWAPAAPLLDPSNTPSPQALLETNTDFFVILRTMDGCETTDTVTALVIEPFPWNDIEETRCPDDPLNINLPELASPYILRWNPAPPPDTIGVEDVDLTLTITDSLGCFLDEYIFFVQSVSDSLLVPNFFSPNGDNVNDEFRIFSEMDPQDPEQMIITSFKVFNRWGQLVYEGSGPDARWDGQVNGKPAPADVYIYQIIVDITKSGRRMDLKGQVTLAR